MDTRQKILSAQQAAECIRRDANVTVVTGHFDPLTAVHARRLVGLRKTRAQIVAVITDPPQPILKLSARTELVAALQAVDYVIAAKDNTTAEIIALLRPSEVIDEQSADMERTRNLIAHVHGRQIAKSE